MKNFDIKTIPYDFIRAVKTALVVTVSAISGFFQSERQQAQARTQQLQAQQQEQCIQDFMYRLSNDLFAVLRGRNYYFVRTVTAVADIRLSGFRTVNGRLLYSYELTKTTSQTAAHAVLGQVRRDINSDMERARHYLLSVYGAQAFLMSYPFLYYGLYITGIADTGTAIRIDVTTDCRP